MDGRTASALVVASLGLCTASALAADLAVTGSIGTDLVDLGVSVTKGEPGLFLNAEYGERDGVFAGLDAHNIDFVPNGALDRNLFVRLSPYVGYRRPVGEDWRLSALARYVVLPDAIPGGDYASFELAADWRDVLLVSLNHSDNRFNRRAATTAFEVAGTWPIAPGLAVRGLAGFHDFDSVGGSDYRYAGMALVASSERFDIELAYHALDADGDRMFAQIGGEQVFVLTVSGRRGRQPAWAKPAAPWLGRVSLYGELRSQYIASGIAQTFGSPAVQLGIEYATPGGTYFEIWGSNVDYVPDGDPTVGADSEIDYTLGHRFAIGKAWKVAARVSYYAYPGAENRKHEWDEHEFIVEGTWHERLRLKVGYTPNAAGVDQPRVSYAARWKQPLGEHWRGSLELGHKDKRDWGATYNWSQFELSRSLGNNITGLLRYWITSQGGRRDNGTADPAWELALGWGL